MPDIIWFRSDLRLKDNPALAVATKGGRPVVAVFLVSRDQWREHHWGPNRINFVLRNVVSVQADLAKLGIPLFVRQADRFSDAAGELSKIARVQKADQLHYNIEYEVNELARDEQVSEELGKLGVEVVAHEDQTILPPHLVRTKGDTFFKVFTPYSSAWRAMVAERLPLKLSPKPRKRGEPAKVADKDNPLKWLVTGEADGIVDRWPAGEAVAAQRLAKFAGQAIHTYQQQRDLPAVDGTSSLSAYLACGVISARQCLTAALDANDGMLGSGSKDINTWINELIWREFYRHVLVGWPKVCRDQPFKHDTRNIPWHDDREQFQRWCDGQTGFPIVDAAMRQLLQTGWMHNRLRMIVAMFLTKDLLIDWRWGERFFMNQLIDGDFASNNGGWQWASSTGTDAVPYFRIFNPVSQSTKFDKQGEFIRRYVPELSELDNKSIHDPSPLQRSAADYPEPIVDHREARQRTLDAFGKSRSG